MLYFVVFFFVTGVTGNKLFIKWLLISIGAKVLTAVYYYAVVGNWLKFEESLFFYHSVSFPFLSEKPQNKLKELKI